MFFIFSKVLAPLLQPLTYIVLAVAAALIFYRVPRIGRTSLIVALGLIFLFGTPVLPKLLLRRLEQAYEIPPTLPRVDAIIVLTGMVNLKASSEGRVEFGDGAERILAGMLLLRQGMGERLLIIGGSGDVRDQSKRESVLLRQLAIDLGIPAEQILIDPDSRNTYENAVNAGELLRQHGLTTSVLVTSAAHMPRSMGCFRNVGLEPIPYPVDFIVTAGEQFYLSDLIPNIGSLQHSSRAIYEYVGLLMYRWAGYL
jgi:uncharacterized SAM-binding protein YcdF (DUF218 family)